MSDWSYSEEELDQYFRDPSVREEDASPNGASPNDEAEHPKSGVRGFFHRRINDPKIAQAAFALSVLLAIALSGVLVIGIYMLTLTDELPSTQSLENPTFQLATVAYTADGEELARYARQNRSWVPYDSISTHAINALIATEDHRFYDHWGMDIYRTLSAVAQTLMGDVQGGSTITQQLARNLYNEQVGREQTIGRKLKEMVTAIQLEQRYTKREIIEMYLNTVSFGSNSFGIEAAARTYYGVPASKLSELQAATLIGSLKAVTYYNPVRNPSNAKLRRNVVLSQMVKRGHLTEQFYEENREVPIDAEYHSAMLHASMAPHFAEHVRNWTQEWAQSNGRDLYSDGLRVYTTLDSELQKMANEAVQNQMKGLQAVVDYEWSQPSGELFSQQIAPYLEKEPGEDYEPFSYYWRSHPKVVNDFIRSTDRYRDLRKQDVSESEALKQLKENEAFIDSLRNVSTQLEAGMVSMDPRNGYIKVWVGGRDFKRDKYDKVAIAKRQPGSTFKPFVYTAAIDNGYSPYDTFMDSTFTWTDTGADTTWSPRNFGGSTGQMLTLSQGLARSKNTITGRLVLEVKPSTVAFYARRMGIESDMEEVPSIALGTSNVSLLEMTAAYGTLASGGLYHPPVVVTRIEDRYGNVLFEATPTPREALSERTAYTVVDMMRGVIDYGTGIRMRTQFKMGGYDLAGKTGTTQQSADGWFMLMHPDLVTGAWVGFNDQRMTFRTNWWGQGAHNALFLVGDFIRSAANAEDSPITETSFPMVEQYGAPEAADESDDDTGNGRVGW